MVVSTGRCFGSYGRGNRTVVVVVAVLDRVLEQNRVGESRADKKQTATTATTTSWSANCLAVHAALDETAGDDGARSALDVKAAHGAQRLGIGHHAHHVDLAALERHNEPIAGDEDRLARVERDARLAHALERIVAARRGHAVERHAVRGHTLIDVDEAVDGEEQDAANRWRHGHAAYAVRGQLLHRPDDRMRALREIERESHRVARVLLDRVAAHPRHVRLAEYEERRLVVAVEELDVDDAYLEPVVQLAQVDGVARQAVGGRFLLLLRLLLWVTRRYVRFALDNQR